MRLRTFALAVVAGVAAFLLAGVAATEIASARVEFSVLVGIPVGTVAGVAAAAFVLVLLIAAGAGLPVVSSLVAAIAVGAAVAAGTYTVGRKE